MRLLTPVNLRLRLAGLIPVLVGAISSGVQVCTTEQASIRAALDACLASVGELTGPPINLEVLARASKAIELAADALSGLNVVGQRLRI